MKGKIRREKRDCRKKRMRKNRKTKGKLILSAVTGNRGERKCRAKGRRIGSDRLGERVNWLEEE